MNANETQQLVTNLCQELKCLWALSNYSHSYYRNERKRVVTHTKNSLSLLPKSRFITRGLDGVQVTTFEKAIDADKDITFHLLTDSLVEPPRWQSQYQSDDVAETKGV